MSRVSRLLSVLGLFAALSLAGPVAANAAPDTAAPATPGGHATSAVDCYSVNFTRPTATGSHADPCAHKELPVEGNLSIVRSGVHLWWSCSPTPCAPTDIRGYTQICKYQQPQYTTRVQADNTVLGRFTAPGGVLAVQATGPVNSGTGNCATQYTPWRAVKSCGGANITNLGWSAWTHSYWSARYPSGALATGDFLSSSTYYRFTNPGTTCT